jgi:hypothetical protein
MIPVAVNQNVGFYMTLVPAVAAAEAPLPAVLPQGIQQQPSVRGRVVMLSQDVEGCRMLQDLLNSGIDDNERLQISGELRGHIWESICDKHANHVVQACVQTLRPEHSQFIIDELIDGGLVQLAAQNKFGCRVLQRLMEYCTGRQLKPLVEILLSSAEDLCKHPFGSYVMQHVLEHAEEGQQQSLWNLLIEEASSLCKENFACLVLDKALTEGAAMDRLKLARACISHGGLVSMARSRFGSQAVKTILILSEAASNSSTMTTGCIDLFEVAREQLREAASIVRASRYGRSVLAALKIRGASLLTD